MNRTADTFFNDQEKKRIADATHQAELRTSGEVAVMVAGSSDSYRDAEIIGGIVLGSITAFALTEMFFDAQIWYYIPLSILFFFPFQRLTRLLPLLKAVFIGPGRRQEAVAQRALKHSTIKGFTGQGTIPAYCFLYRFWKERYGFLRTREFIQRSTRIR